MTDSGKGSKSWQKRVGNIPLTMENGNQLLFKGDELVSFFRKYLLTSPTTRYEMLSALKFSSEQMLELERNIHNVANAYTQTIREILTAPSRAEQKELEILEIDSSMRLPPDIASLRERIEESVPRLEQALKEGTHLSANGRKGALEFYKHMVHALNMRVERMQEEGVRTVP